jgi:hypothetical protein
MTSNADKQNIFELPADRPDFSQWSGVRRGGFLFDWPFTDYLAFVETFLVGRKGIRAELKSRTAHNDGLLP